MRRKESGSLNGIDLRPSANQSGPARISRVEIESVGPRSNQFGSSEYAAPLT